MRHILLVIFSIIALTVHSQQLELSELYQNQIYPELNAKNTDKSNPDYFFYKAAFAHACNKNRLSINYLDSLENIGISDTIAYDYAILKFDNYVKLFDYKNAAASILEVVEKFESILTESQKKSLMGAYSLWQAAEEVLPQQIQSLGTCKIPYIKDQYGLTNIQVTINGIDTNFIFDTGAEKSNITESLAQALGFRFLVGNFPLRGSTGAMSHMRLAVAPVLRIGNIKIENVLFNVVPDYTLTFDNYKINGIIGLSVAKELGTLIFEKDTLTLNPLKQINKGQTKNLFIKLGYPILLLTHEGRTLPFLFDTGSATSTFSSPFYINYKESLKGKHRTRRYQGLGGAKHYKVLIVKHLNMKLAQSTLSFSNLVIHKKDEHSPMKSLYGIIGQDLLQNYKRMIISFDENYLSLEN